MIRLNKLFKRRCVHTETHFEQEDDEEQISLGVQTNKREHLPIGSQNTSTNFSIITLQKSTIE